MGKNLIVRIAFIVAIIVVVGIKVFGDIIINTRNSKSDVSKIKFKLKMNQDEKIEESANPFDFVNIDKAAKKSKNTDDVPNLFGDNSSDLKEEKEAVKETLHDKEMIKEDKTEEDIPKLDFSKRVSVSRLARSEMDKENQEKTEENSDKTNEQ